MITLWKSQIPPPPTPHPPKKKNEKGTKKEKETTERASMGLTDRRKTAKNLVHSRKN